LPNNNEFYKRFPQNMKNKNCIFIYYKNLQKQPNQEWLDKRKEFKKIKDFEGIIIYEYLFF